MTLIPFFSKGLLYDTERRMVRCRQLVRRFTLGDGVMEKCVVTDVRYEPGRGYSYTLVGLKTLVRFAVRFIFDERDTDCGICADCEFPAFLSAEQTAGIMARSVPAGEPHRRPPDADEPALLCGAVVVDYSARSFAIFTDNPADTAILMRIRAKRNASLTYRGRRTAGWIFPKYRQKELRAVMIPP